MNDLPKQSAYRSSINFTEGGIVANPTTNVRASVQYEQPQPFSRAKEYDVDIETLNENDP